jgi:hypothetical protein
MADPTQPAAPAAPGEIPVLTPDGQLGTVPAANAQAASAAGYRVITDPAELDQLQAQAKFGGAGGTALAGLAGAGRGLTFGASDLALTESGAVAPETLKGLKEANPIASTVGTVAGAALPVLATAGEAAPLEAAALGAEGAQAAGAVARVARGAQGARGLLEAAGMLPRAAAGAGEAVGGAVGRLAGEGLGGQMLAGAARGAVEGGLYGAGDAISESAIENKPLTAESLLASVGPSALLGGALGGAFEGALGLAKTAAPPALERASAKLEQLSGKLEEMGPTARVEHFAKALDTLNETGAGVVEDAVGVRNQLIDHALDGQAPVDKAEKVAAYLRHKLASIEDGGPYQKSALKALDRLDQRLSESSTALEQFRALDQAKNELYPLSQFERDLALNKVQKLALAPVRDAWSQTRALLEDESVWGKAGAVQREFNGRLSALAEDSKAFGSKTLRKALGSEEGEEAINGKVADTLKAESILRNEASESTRSQLKAAQNTQALKGYTDRLKELADFARGEAGDLPTGQVRDVGAFLRDFEASKAAGVKAFKPSALEHVEHFLPHGIAGPLGAIGKLSRQTEVVSVVARKAAEVSRQTARLIREGLAGSGGKGAASAGVLSRVSWGSSTHPGETRHEAIARHMADHATLGTDPQGLADKLAASTPTLARHAPTVAGQVQIAAVRAQAYLAQQAPKSPVPPSGLPGQPKWQPPASEVARFERITRAVERPLSLVEDFAAGQVSPDAVAAVRSVYPELYKQIQQQAAQHLASARGPIPMSVQLQLSTLLDAPVAPAQRIQSQLQAVMTAAISQPSPGPSGNPAAASIQADDRASTNLSRSSP